MIIIGAVPFEVKIVIGALLPVASSQYWFATCYIFLLLISPALQLFIQNVSQEGFKKILVVLFFAWCVIPQLHLGNPGYSNFGWFIFLYLLSAYVKLYPKEWMLKIKPQHGLGAFLVVCIATVITYKFGYTSDFFRENAIYLYGEMNMFPALVCAVFLFLGFCNWNAKTNTIVNRIANCTFGVYLIHDNPNFRLFLWQDICSNCDYIGRNYFTFRMVISVLLIFGFCIVIELGRQTIAKRMKKIC